jgi:predicted dehydrogenase
MAHPLKALLVGCGSISRVWIPPVHHIPDFELIGFVDLNLDAAKTRAEQYGKPNVYVGTDLDAALKQLQPDIVFDCTVPTARAHVVLKALEHGCHVLSEKPMANSMDEARRMIEAAQRAGKLFAVMQNRRNDPNIRAVKNTIAAGGIGGLTTIHSDFFIGAHFNDFRDHMAHILLLDMAIHTFDAARFISGADAVSVYCKEWNPAGSWYERDSSAVAIFEMSNGVVYTYRGSWCAEGLITTWESDWRVIGQRGSLTWDGARAIRAQSVDKTEALISSFTDLRVTLEPPSEWGQGHSDAIRDFVDCVRTGRTPQTICTDNIKSLAMVFGAIQSTEEGRVVKIEE